MHGCTAIYVIAYFFGFDAALIIIRSNQSISTLLTLGQPSQDPWWIVIIQGLPWVNHSSISSPSHHHHWGFMNHYLTRKKCGYFKCIKGPNHHPVNLWLTTTRGHHEPPIESTVAAWTKLWTFTGPRIPPRPRPWLHGCRGATCGTGEPALEPGVVGVGRASLKWWRWAARWWWNGWFIEMAKCLVKWWWTKRAKNG